MHFGEIKKVDIANGPGVRVSLFVSGCTHHCRDCFNAETWRFHFGTEFTTGTQEEILEALEPDHIAGLTVLGGEPFEPDNQRALLPLIREVRKRLPEKTVWMYSGYLFDREIRSNLPEGTVLPPDKAVEALAPGEGVNVISVSGGKEYAEVWYRVSHGRKFSRAGGDDLITLSGEDSIIRLPAPYRSAHCEVTDELLTLIDVLVDGKFIFMEKDLSLQFRGSRNQRLIDVPATLSSQTLTLWQGRQA